MKKKILFTKKLEVQSFITNLPVKSSDNLKGGDLTNSNCLQCTIGCTGLACTTFKPGCSEGVNSGCILC